jgi:hypothetical protein
MRQHERYGRQPEEEDDARVAGILAREEAGETLTGPFHASFPRSCPPQEAYSASVRESDQRPFSL